MPSKDIQILWGAAAAYCSLCQKDLLARSAATGQLFHVGQNAHIVGKKTSKKRSARSSYPIRPDEIDFYPNLILLCTECHTEIDKEENEINYPVELLREKKAQHEQWARGHKRSNRDELITHAKYQYLIEVITDALQLENWRSWTNSVLGAYRVLPNEIQFGVDQLTEAVDPLVLPGAYPDLDRALELLSIASLRMVRHFESGLNPTNTEGGLLQDSFHKVLRQPGTQASKDLIAQDEYWNQELFRELCFMTNCANLVIDKIRRFTSDLYFIDRGTNVRLQGRVYKFSNEEEEVLLRVNRADLAGTLDAMVKDVTLPGPT